MINIPKGTKDVLPSESAKWQYVEAKAREICALFNLKEIRTPAFEHTELFLRSVGEDSDVVSKEMYTFLDKGGRSISLKPEGTAPVARSFIENSLDAAGLPLKTYYFTPCFRYERPQAGRLREHHQFGAEFYSDATPYMDAEAINLAYMFLKNIGITDLTAQINSIGCPVCRAEYNKALKQYLGGKLNEMCPTCGDRFGRNPLRILDCKEPKCREIVKSAPVILDYLCPDCKTHFDKLKELLTAAGVPFAVNPWIVRGLDYYTGPVFEFITTALGAQGTVCGGGRYDNLIESMGGKPTPCVGFAMGLERLIMLLEQTGVPFPENNLDYYVIVQSPACLDFCVSLVARLRAKGYSADTDFTGRSLKAQFKFADRQKASFAIVVGESEVQTGIVGVKRLSDGETVQKRIEEI